MSDFAFRKGKAAMHGPASLERSSTGLWSGKLSHYAGDLTTRGHFSKAQAKASLDKLALGHYGRVPVYIKEDPDKPAPKRDELSEDIGKVLHERLAARKR